MNTPARLTIYVLANLSCAAICAPQAAAQRGDRRGHVMEEVWREMDVPPAPILTPPQALKSLRVAPGFRVELVAAEPLIEDPVALAWDGDGRIWAVEMRGYMPNVDGKGEDVRNGRVVVLEDADGDGRMDQSTVFLDGLQMPRAIAMVSGGVLVAEPPYLWYCRDNDGDLKCDEKTQVAKYARQGPVEHTENGLLPALDNWIYNAKSSRRFRFTAGKIVEEKTRGRGQWGICQDDYGRLYYTSNSRYLFVDWQTYHDTGRKFDGNPVRTSEVFSIRVNPGINRGYQKGMLRPDGRLARVTAVSGPAIYRGDRYAEPYRGSAFVCEPAANAVACFTLEESGNGLKSNHLTFVDERWGQREFLCSTDERFRPVSIYNGPDGCLYVVDMYRGILQHKVYVTSFLRKQIIERGLDKPVGLGRIYRIVPADRGPAKPPSPRLQGADSGKLIAALSHGNGWWRDTAQRLLVERRDLSAVTALRSLAANGTNHLGRIHALWTLEGMRALDAATVTRALLTDEHTKVRLTGLVVSEQVTGGDSLAAVSTRAAVAAAASDADSQVSSLALHMLKRYSGEAQAAAPTTFSAPEGEHGKRFAAGRERFMTTCFACHQPSGAGLPGVAPTLVRSEWVTGSTDRLIRIALDGMSGPLVVKGQRLENLPVMPGHRALANDAQLADVLTYVRWAWGNRAGPIEAAQVKRVRAATATRQLPWTAKELQELD